MSWSIFVPIFAALAGAFVGGLLTEVRSVLDGAREHRRTLRRVLYRQLDILWEVRRRDVNAIIEITARALAPKVQMSVEDVLASVADSPLKEFFNGIIDEYANPQLAERYQAAVDELASVDPLLAFRLSGKAALTRSAHYWTNLKPVSDQLILDIPLDERRRVEGPVENLVNDRLRRSALQTLEEDVLKVAKKLGWKTRREVRATLSRIAELASEELEEEASELMTAFFRIIKQFEQERPAAGMPTIVP